MIKRDKLLKLRTGSNKNIASLMVGNDAAMIDFLLLMEPSLDRDVLERAAKDGNLWKHEFDPKEKTYEEEIPND